MCREWVCSIYGGGSRTQGVCTIEVEGPYPMRPNLRSYRVSAGSGTQFKSAAWKEATGSAQRGGGKSFESFFRPAIKRNG